MKLRLYFVLVLILLALGASARTTATVTLTKLEHTYDGTQKSVGCETVPANLATKIKYSNAGSGTGRIDAGSYGVTCTVTERGHTGSASGTMVIARADQTIDFPPLADRPLGEPFAVAVSASSGLPVTLTSTTPQVCAVSGATVTLLAAGACAITASQEGNINYNAAEKVAQSFTIASPSSLNYLVAYDSGLQDDWNITTWEDGDHPVDANPAAPAPGRSGNAIEVQFSANGYGAFGLANMTDWNNVHYMYLNEFRTIEFDLYIAPDATGMENLYFILDDTGYCNEPPLVSFIEGWTPGRWIPVTIDLASLEPTVPRFLRFLFYNAAGASRPHFYMANVRLGWQEDTTPPVFTSVSVTPNLTYTALTAAFTTDKATTWRVEYGAGAYDHILEGDELATSHTVTLPNVTRGNTYQYRITTWAHSANPVPGIYTGTYAMPPAPTAPPVIASFVATPAEIAAGESAKLTWSATDYDTLTIEPGVGSVALIPGATGVSVRPPQSTEYTITATNAMGSSTRTVTVVTHAVPTVHHFTATPEKIGAGQSATLTWNVENFDTITIDHGVGDVTALPSVSVSPAETTTYVLTASNAYGTVRQTVTVTRAASSTNPVWVMGYYIGYQRHLQAPADVDYTSMTHIMVGAVVPRTNGTFGTHFYLGDTEGPRWARETVQRAHAAGIKAILMVGGAGSVDGFLATSNPTVRAAFVSNLKALVQDLGFDGIDLDWEPLEPRDRVNVVTLMNALQAPDALPRSQYIYTLPVGWNNANFENMADPFYGEVSAYFDRVSMMSYSMMWLGDGWQSWHSSALYGETPNAPSSIDDTVQALRAAGVPDAKIGLGIGFYGQAVENGTWSGGTFVHLDPPAIPGYVTGPYQDTDFAASRYGDNALSYSNIMRYIHSGAAYRWDDAARVPYFSFSTPALFAVPGFFNDLKTTFLTYENEQSIAEKGSYLRTNNLGGVIIWTISQGYLEWKTTGERDPLMKAIVKAFR